MSAVDFETMNWEAIISRVRSGMTRDIDGTWLEEYHKKLLDIIQEYKTDLENAYMVLEDWTQADIDEYYRNCNE